MGGMISEFTDDIKVGGVAIGVESCVWLQRDDVLVKWAKKKLADGV